LACNVSATRKRLQRPFCRPCNYTAQTPKPFTELYSGVSVDLPYSSARNAANTQTACAPTAPRWRAYRQAQHLPQYQIPPQHRTLYRAGQSPIIIRYIRVQLCAPVMDPCQTVQHIADHASPATCDLAPVSSQGVPSTRRAVQQQRRGGRRGTIDGYRRISFRAFAR
jgi:hypothetical protein